MFLVNIPHIEQIAQKALDSATLNRIIFDDVFYIAMIFQILLGLKHITNLCLRRVFHQIFLQSCVCPWAMQMVCVQTPP